MTDQITVGLVGLGSIARKAHLPVLAVHPGINITAMASRSGARVADLAAQYRLNLQATTFEAMLAKPPRAAYVLSSTDAHAEHAMQLLAAGVAVYLEKPLANDLHSARLITAAAELPGRLLMVGFNRRYAPAYQRALSLFKDRTIELVQIHKHRNGDHSGWSLRQIIMDDTIHSIDLARCLTGPDLQRQASHARLGLVTAQLATPGGTVAQLSQSFGAGAATERVELHGGGLTVIIEQMETLRILERGAERSEPVFGSWTTTLEKRGIAPATEHFLNCIRTGAQPNTPAREALQTQELAEAILLG